jgi:hypothetical protein
LSFLTAAQFGADFVGMWNISFNFDCRSQFLLNAQIKHTSNTLNTHSFFFIYSFIHFNKKIISFMLEFDVQLTKDKVPVLFHDIEICVREDCDGNKVNFFALLFWLFYNISDLLTIIIIIWKWLDFCSCWASHLQTVHGFETSWSVRHISSPHIQTHIKHNTLIFLLFFLFLFSYFDIF